jgi:hypothetical protein
LAHVFLFYCPPGHFLIPRTNFPSFPLRDAGASHCLEYLSQSLPRSGNPRKLELGAKRMATRLFFVLAARHLLHIQRKIKPGTSIVKTKADDRETQAVSAPLVAAVWALTDSAQLVFMVKQTMPRTRVLARITM